MNTSTVFSIEQSDGYSQYQSAPTVICAPIARLPEEEAGTRTSPFSSENLTQPGCMMRNAAQLVVLPKPDLGLVDIGYFDIRQHFEGYVTHIDERTFVAIVKDRANQNNPDEEVTISLDEVAAGDRALVIPGAVFYWYLGYANYPGVPRARQSRINVRRLAGWTEGEISRVYDEARRIAEYFATT